MTVRSLDDIKAQYGLKSPEYAARVYEDMLDARYERVAALYDEIKGIGDHLEREKRDIAMQRAARRRLAAWREHEADVDNTALAAIADDGDR